MSRPREASKQVIKGFVSRLAKQAGWKLVLWAIGAILAIGWPVLLFIVIVGVVASVAGSFTLGDFTGVNLSKNQQQYVQENAYLKRVYAQAAHQWENGLNAQQQQIVRAYQVFLPTSVLLTMGKFADKNFASKNQVALAKHYYSLLEPKYTWVQGTVTTTTKKWVIVPVASSGKKSHSSSASKTNSNPKTKRVIRTTVTTSTVWELRRADTWNGTFTSSWTTKTIGRFHNGVGTETVEPYMTGQNMTYNHSKFYEATAKYGFTKADVDPLWYEAIYAMQSSEFTNQHNQYAYLLDPKLMQWGPVFGIALPPSPGSPGAGTIQDPAQIMKDVNAAIKIDSPYGIPSTWVPYIMDIIGKESGGNPDAVNPQAIQYAPGVYEHAEGIMQMMPSTFMEYAVPGHPDIWSATDNIAAALRYIQSVFKDPTAINGIGNGLPYQGY